MDENIIVRCPKCGTKNRVPRSRMGDKPACGKCKAALNPDSSPSMPVDVTDLTFEREVLGYKGPVLLDCWAPWCGPCKMVAPILDQLASEYSGQVKIAKLNVDENPRIASMYGIQSIPTMIFFDMGEKVNQVIGAQPKQEIETFLKAIL